VCKIDRLGADAYNNCIEALRDFRAQHLEYAGLYIHSQSQRNTANPTTVGTGGTPFMQYLKAHCQVLDRYLAPVEP
jgi:indoleamine 2,3-dioxygenase